MLTTWAVISVLAGSAAAADVSDMITKGNITGGLVAQVGVRDPLLLKGIGQRFHVRLIAPDAENAAAALKTIAEAGLQGQFTVDTAPTGKLPFADRVLNALVIFDANGIPAEEQRRVLAPRGLLIELEERHLDGDGQARSPDTIDQWTHFLYDASGNAVSKDKEVASPRSFRWYAPPKHLRSHNYSSSFTGLVSAGGRLFYILDEGTFLFDKGGATEKFSLIARDAFNGALLWKKTLEGYGQPFYEDVSGQAVNDFIWRTPLSMNRRLVAVERESLCGAQVPPVAAVRTGRRDRRGRSRGRAGRRG